MGKLLFRLGLMMRNRYGTDALYYALVLLSAVLMVFSFLLRRIRYVGMALTILWLIVLFYAFARFFSTNIEKRRRENESFLRLLGRYGNDVSSRLQDFSTGTAAVQKRDPDKKYVKCPKCKSTLRVPRQKGKHTVRCPRCDHRFQIRIIFGAKKK